MTKNVILSKWEDKDFLSSHNLPISVSRGDIETAILDSDPTTQKRWAGWISELWISQKIHWSDISEGSASRVGMLLRDYEVVRPHLSVGQRSLMLHNSMKDIQDILSSFKDIRTLTLDTFKARNESLSYEFDSGLTISIPLSKHAAIVGGVGTDWFGQNGKFFQSMYDDGPLAVMLLPGGGRYLVHIDVSEIDDEDVQSILHIRNEANEIVGKQEWKDINVFHHDFERAIHSLSRGFDLNMDRGEFVSGILCQAEALSLDIPAQGINLPATKFIELYSDEVRKTLSNPLSDEAQAFYYCPPENWCPSDLTDDPIAMDIVKVSASLFMQDVGMQSLFSLLRERKITWDDFSISIEDEFTRTVNAIECLPGQTTDDVLSAMKETMKSIEDEREVSEWRAPYPEL